MQVAGEALLVHVIDDPADDETVQVEAVVKSNVVSLEVPCAMKLWFVVLFAAFTFQVRGVEPLEQEVVAPNVPMHTSKLVMLPRYAVAVAVALRPCAAAVIVAVPPVPSPVATPVFESIDTTVLSLLVHTTPLVIWLLVLS